jgi:hypothetical protein
VELTHQRCAEEGAIAMHATVRDVMTTHVVAVRLNATYKDMTARLGYPPQPRSVSRTDMNLDF